MITATQAKRFMDDAKVAHLANIENRAKEWLQDTVAEQIENNAKKGFSSVTVLTQGVLPSMKIFINEILREGGYNYNWNKMNSLTIRWN